MNRSLPSAAPSPLARDVSRLKFRDVAQARSLNQRLTELVGQAKHQPVSVMHVCGSHEQAIARFGLRSVLPEGLDVIMGPGCPVCVTDAPEVDEAVALAQQGIRVATYGDMLRVPGSAASLADAQAQGARVEVVYSVIEAVELARGVSEEVVFFASGFETTAVATAAALLAGPPPNFSVLSAHKFVPPAMSVVARVPGTRVEGFLAAGHAATITGWEIFEDFSKTFGMPVVVAGFEPLDILAALTQLLALIVSGEPRVVNAFPRCVTRHGNQRALSLLWQVFETANGQWRGIAEIPDGNLRLRSEFSAFDARRRFGQSATLTASEPRVGAEACLCGKIMTGLAAPSDCPMFGRQCQPDTPVGACMVSSEGTCRIWHEYGGRPDLRALETGDARAPAHSSVKGGQP